MELMIKHSEFLTIVIQAFLITFAGFLFVGSWNELLEDIRKSKRILRKKKARRRV